MVELDEVSAGDFAAVGEVLKNLDGRHGRMADLEAVANWKLAFNLFRKLDFQYMRSTNRGPMEQAHRAVLTSLLAGTESLAARIARLSDEELGKVAFSRQAFDVCANLVRRKYRVWNVPMDPKLVADFEAKMSQEI